MKDGSVLESLGAGVVLGREVLLLLGGRETVGDNQD